MRTETRRELKHDRFAETVAEQYSWAVDHRDKLIYGGVAVLVIIAIVLGVSAYRNSQNGKASEALASAMNTYTAPILPAGAPPEPGMQTFSSYEERSKAAHAEFARIADQYPHTDSGDVARYFSGVTSQSLNDKAAAEQDLKKVADSGNKDLASLAKLALAGIYAQTNRTNEAVEIYKNLADHPTNSVGKFTAQLQLADLYQQTQPQEAAKIYAQVQKDDPNGMAGQMAARNLAGK